MHISETIKEENYIKNKFGKTSVELLDEFGLLKDAILVHCCYIEESDVDLIARRRAHVVVCPTSNIRLGNRLPPLNNFIDKNLNISIATDGLATNTSNNIFYECLTLKKNIPNINDKELINMITVNPAKALSLPIGEIKKGNKADLAVFNSNIIKSNFNNLLSLLKSNNCNDVIINGNIILKNYRVLNLNRNKIEKNFKEVQSLIKNNLTN